MALKPHVSDPNAKEVQAKIAKLEKQGTAQGAEKLKAEHNIDVGGKSRIVTK